MAWAFLGVSNVVEVTATSHPLVTTGITGTLQAGDLLVACISSRIASTTSVTLPVGWTLVSEQKNNNVLTTTSAASSGLMAYCVRGASNPALTFTHPVAPNVAIGRIVAYREVSSAAPKDTQTSFTTAIATTAVSGTGLTTTEANDLIVAMAAGGQEAAWSAFNATSQTGPSGATSTAAPTTTWQERADSLTTTGADTSLAIFDTIKATAGATGNLTATASLGASHVIVAGAFKSGLATGTGTPAAQTSTIVGNGTVVFPGIQDAWSAFDKSAGVTLSNSDRTATTTTADTGVRSTTRRLSGTAGKYYAELVFNTVIANDPQLGISRSANVVIEASANTVRVLPASGDIIKDVSTLLGNVGGACISGDVIRLAWDAGAKRIWFCKNNGLWNNNVADNPATGTNGLDVSSLPNSDFSLWMSNLNAGAVRGATVRAENNDFTYSGPSGFTSWMGETLAAPAITGTGTPTAQASDTDGLGTSSSQGSGTPASQASAVSGLGAVSSAGVTGDGAIAAQASDVDGVGVSAWISSGALVATAATVAGEGLSSSIGTGTATAQSSAASGVGIVVWVGTGALVVQASDVDGAGLSASTGGGEVAAATATVVGTGAVSFAEATGTGALAAVAAAVAGAGFSSSAGTGNAVAGTAAVAGTGTIAAGNSGALVAESAAVAGEGVSSSICSGALQVGAAAVAGVGLSVSTGSGALACSPVTIEGVGVVLEEGATVGVGDLLAGAASISGEGEVTGEIAPPVTEGSGGYHYRPDRRPLPVEGYGYGILPQIEGEAHGVVIAAGRSIGTLPRFLGQADAAAGTAGSSAAQLTVKATALGVAGARGKGSGMIVKFEGAAAGRHDDDEAAIVAWLLAA